MEVKRQGYLESYVCLRTTAPSLGDMRLITDLKSALHDLSARRQIVKRATEFATAVIAFIPLWECLKALQGVGRVCGAKRLEC